MKSKTGAVLVILFLAGASPGGITYDDVTMTLTYGDPSDLDSAVDPQGVLADVEQSFGIQLADFNALTPQVVGFNSCTGDQGATGKPLILVAYYTAAETVTSTFPTQYNYGGFLSYSRRAFSGTEDFHMLGTVETQPDNCWFEADVAVSEAGKGVTAFGLCVHGREMDPAGPNGPGQAIFSLSDGSTEAVDYPAFGGAAVLQRIFIGYQAPAGLGIGSVRCTRPRAGNSYLAVDDLSFLVDEALPPRIPGDVHAPGQAGYGCVDGADYTTWADHYEQGCPLAAAVPEPTGVALLVLGAVAAVRKRR